MKANSKIRCDILERQLATLESFSTMNFNYNFFFQNEREQTVFAHMNL